MNEAFVEVNGVRTKIITWGRWIEESPGTNNEIIILIPGNPGIADFYKKFAEILYKQTEIPVWCLSHAGHNFTDNTLSKFPRFDKHKNLYSLEGQIDHKIDFFKKFVPIGTKVHLIGHSIGSYISLKILENEWVKQKIYKSYLLFPTIEKMAETRNGKFLNLIIRNIVWLLLILTWILSNLPTSIFNLLLYGYMFIANIPYDLHADNIRDLLKPPVLKKVFFMAFEEMDLVKHRDNSIIVNNVQKIKFLYGKTDGWAPENYFTNLKKDISNVDLELTDSNHSFVFHHNEAVAKTCADWINKS